MTFYGRNKNRDDEIKNIAGRIQEATRIVKTSQKLELRLKSLLFLLNS